MTEASASEGDNEAPDRFEDLLGPGGKVDRDALYRLHAARDDNDAPVTVRFEPNPAEAGGLVLVGASARDLGTFRPQSSHQLTISLVALEPGLKKLGGITLLDTLTEQTFDVGPLADVFVTEP